MHVLGQKCLEEANNPFPFQMLKGKQTTLFPHAYQRKKDHLAAEFLH